jgi:hypothetical protein
MKIVLFFYLDSLELRVQAHFLYLDSLELGDENSTK